MAICLERSADLHMAQLMPLPLAVSCFSKIQIGFTFLVLTRLGSPGQRAVKPVVCVYRICDMDTIRYASMRYLILLSTELPSLAAAAVVVVVVRRGCWQGRKDVSQIFNNLLRRQIGTRSPTVEHILMRRHILTTLLAGCVPVCLLVWWSVSLFVSLSVCQSLCLFVSLSACLSVCLPVHFSLHPSVCLCFPCPIFAKFSAIMESFMRGRMLKFWETHSKGSRVMGC